MNHATPAGQSLKPRHPEANHASTQPFDHDDAATLAVIYELLLSGGDDEYDAPGATADAWAGPLAPPCPPCVPRNRAERRALRRRR